MKFKKFISLILAIFFLGSHVGVAFNVHYCDDAIASISIKSSSFKNKPCSGCCEKVEKESHSCKDKVINVEKKTDKGIVKSNSFQFYLLEIPHQNHVVSFLFQTNFKNNINTTYYCDANAPPFFKLYNQFIFYDQF